jgi:putative DNA methylase
MPRSLTLSEHDQRTTRKSRSATPTLLEVGLPFRELSLIAQADRRAVDPVYATHKWWARRPPGVIRGLLLAADMPDTASLEDFWDKFREAKHHLEGKRVHDMFAGGGAMLVEASRLGATPSGTDVDPLAIEIVRHELDPPDAKTLAPIADRLLAALKKEFDSFYPGSCEDAIPLHYFYLHIVSCPSCKTEGPLYKSLIIARDVKKSGGVLRNHAITAFCPECFHLRLLPKEDQKSFRCCGKQWDLDTSTFSGGKFTCAHCSTKSDHAQLKTGVAPKRLIAVEETRKGSKRSMHEPRMTDFFAQLGAARYVKEKSGQLLYPRSPLETKRADARPLSYGIDTADKLFTDRQLAVFGYAFNWIADQDLERPLRRGLRLALSNALTTNNSLCSYATDYGRIAPLFSIRSYAMPWLSVELNPLHPDAGRGTLVKSINKIFRSSSTKATRTVWDENKQSIARVQYDFPPSNAKPSLRCISATRALDPNEPIDICLFDPPYFDYIAYSELSEFFRLWQSKHALGGTPLLPDSDRPSESFGEDLGACLAQTLKVLRKDRPLTFTFHSLDIEAWKAIAIALRHACVVVSAIWPVLNDAHMGHHGSSGNCEWDLVVVCRRKEEAKIKVNSPKLSEWKKAVSPLKIGKADETAMSIALEVLQDLFAAI